MKQLFLLFTFICIILSCESNKIADRELLTIDWILLAPKPIVCVRLDTTNKEILYNLISVNDSCSYEYMTGYIKLNLPDTIK